MTRRPLSAASLLVLTLFLLSPVAGASAVVNSASQHAAPSDPPEPAYCSTIIGSWDGVSVCTFSGSYSFSSGTLEITSGTTLVISNSGPGTYGITVGSGATLTVESEANIATENSGSTSSGVFVEGTLTNSGNITTENSGSASNGVAVDGGTFTNSGEITTKNSAVGSDGVFNAVGTVTSSGIIAIENSGMESYGVLNFEFQTFINSGTITIESSGTDTAGIVNDGTFTNYGTVTVDNSGSIYGIYNNEIGTITNYGIITIENSGTTGIYNYDGAAIINECYSTITVENTGGTGINSEGTSTVTNNGGTITGYSGTIIPGTECIQYSITFGYADQDSSPIPSGATIGSYMQSGVSFPITAGLTYGATVPAGAMVDSGTGMVSYQTYVAGSTTEQWALSSSPQTFDVSSSTTISELLYYHQFTVTFGYSDQDSSPIVPGFVNLIGTYSQFGVLKPVGVPLVADYGVTIPGSAWVDAGANTVSYTGDEYLPADSYLCYGISFGGEQCAPTEGWLLKAGTDFYSVSSSTTISDSNYFHQFLVGFAYAVSDGSSPTATDAVSYTEFGSLKTVTPLELSPGCSAFGPAFCIGSTPVWVDAGTSASYAAIAGGAGERWAVSPSQSPVTITTAYTPSPEATPSTPDYTATVSGTLGAGPITAEYYHQFGLTLSYSVSGGAGYTAPTFTADQFGSPFGQTLTMSATTYWFDSGATWTLTNPLVGSSAAQTWSTEQATEGTVSSPATTGFSYLYTVTSSQYCYEGSTCSVEDLGSVSSVTFSGYTGSGTASVTTQDYGTSPPSGTPADTVLVNGMYYDVMVSGAITDGNAVVCIPDTSGATVMQYYMQPSGPYADATNVSYDGTICGAIPVSQLTGTLIVIGTPSSAPTPTTGVPEFPLGLGSGLIVAAIGMLALAILTRARAPRRPVQA